MPSSTSPKQPRDRQPARKTTSGARRTTRKTAQPSATAQPIPQPQEDPTSDYAPNTWLSGGIGDMEDVTVPSGQRCLVRRPGMEGLMKAGVLHNVDSLSQIVNEKHLKRVKGKKTDEIDMGSLMQDEEGMAEVTNVIDKVIVHCVVKPEIHRTPDDVTRRQKGVVYCDMIDLLDKMFLFNLVVGGTRDLESFRSGLDAAVGGLEAREGVHDEAQ